MSHRVHVRVKNQVKMAGGGEVAELSESLLVGKNKLKLKNHWFTPGLGNL